jgi:predicted alpha/beta hydrolase family esterase
MARDRHTPRLLVVPGLGDSPSGHWQSWLQAGVKGSVRVTQRDWHAPDLDRWAARVGATLDRADHAGPWLVAAHSFGVLAVLRHLVLTGDQRLAGLLLVAPADPDRFGVGSHLPDEPLGPPSTVVLSSNDPWLSLAAGQHWARRWQAAVLNLGAAGHVNIESGFGPWPGARRWLLAQEQRLARLNRPEHAAWQEWSFAV